jgi:phospholipid transport system substrate-binding protein
MTALIRSIVPVFLVGVLFASASARAADPEGPDVRVRAIYKEVQKASAETKDRDALVDKVLGYLDTFIDYDGFSERTLKTTWPKLTPAQRDLFKARFKRLVIRTYAKKFTPGANFGVDYRGAATFTNDPKTEAKVRTTVKHDDVAADVDYLLVRGVVGGVDAWRAIDIVIDDVSMALNWRRQFEKIVQKDGFDALIKKIDERIAKQQD